MAIPSGVVPASTLTATIVVGIIIGVVSLIALGLWIFLVWAPAVEKDARQASSLSSLSSPVSPKVRLTVECAISIVYIFFLCCSLLKDVWPAVGLFMLVLASCLTLLRPVVENPYSWTALGLMLFCFLGGAITSYGALTLAGQNPATYQLNDQITYQYTGPARIVGFEYKERNDSGGTNFTLATVQFGGEWACPSNPEAMLEKYLMFLGECNEYEDHFRGVTCQFGFDGFDTNNEFDDDHVSSAYSYYFAEEDRAYDPFASPTEDQSWPYTVDIIAGCQSSDSFVAMDSKKTRLWFF